MATIPSVSEEGMDHFGPRFNRAWTPGFTEMEAWPLPAEALDVTWKAGATDTDFGTKARAHAQWERIRAAISSAKGILAAHQKGRSLDELTKAELGTAEHPDKRDRTAASNREPCGLPDHVNRT